MKTKRLIFLLALIFILTTTQIAGAQQATVLLTPTSYTLSNVGLTFTANVTIQSVDDLYAWEFKLYYPNDLLNGTTITEGPFLKTGGFLTFFHTLNFTDSYNATQGLLHVFCSRIGNVSGNGGNGTLASVTFKSLSTDGPRILDLDGVKLSDSDYSSPNQIPCTTVDGEVTVVPEFATSLILPILMIMTIAAMVFRKKTRTYL